MKPKLIINCFLIVFIIVLSSCGRSVNSLFKGDYVKNTTVGREVYKKDNTPHAFNFESYAGEEIKITYLGCGGFNLERDNKSILIDPYFSNQPVLFKLLFSKMGFRSIKSDTTTINKNLGSLFQKHKASSIWISHSHYDHLLDVPYVFEQFTNRKDSTIFCSQSGKNIIKSINTINQNNIVALDSNITTYNKKGNRYFTADNTVRITPIYSGHAPHLFWNIKFFKGEAKTRSKYTSSSNSTRAEWWKEGMPFSFLVDYLDNSGNIEFRIFIQSSAAEPFKGFMPELIRDEHPINLGIIGAASFHNSANYPEKILEYLKPERVIICHWEDFFVNYNRETKKKVRFTNIKKFIQNLDEVYPWKVDGIEKFILPKPGTIVTVE